MRKVLVKKVTPPALEPQALSATFLFPIRLLSFAFSAQRRSWVQLSFCLAGPFNSAFLFPIQFFFPPPLLSLSSVVRGFSCLSALPARSTLRSSFLFSFFFFFGFCFFVWLFFWGGGGGGGAGRSPLLSVQRRSRVQLSFCLTGPFNSTFLFPNQFFPFAFSAQRRAWVQLSFFLPARSPAFYPIILFNHDRYSKSECGYLYDG